MGIHYGLLVREGAGPIFVFGPAGAELLLRSGVYWVESVLKQPPFETTRYLRPRAGL